MVLQHHERLDGSGYPYSLSGDEIHEYARIVMIADVFDAMTSQRPYRPAYSVIQTADFIIKQAGRSLDGDFVDAFISGVLHLSPSYAVKYRGVMLKIDDEI